MKLVLLLIDFFFLLCYNSGIMEAQEVLKLSFDFDISVRIKDKRTGDIISGPKVIPAPASDYAGYEEICWWVSSLFLDLPPAIFRICGKNMGKQYLLEEGAEGNAYTSVPRVALREICSYIFSRSCVPDSELTEERSCSWWEGYEVTNQAKAEELKDFLWSLEYIENRNEDAGIAEKFITDLKKREEFKSNPQGYEFEFMLNYHYCRSR